MHLIKKLAGIVALLLLTQCASTAVSTERTQAARMAVIHTYCEEYTTTMSLFVRGKEAGMTHAQMLSTVIATAYAMEPARFNTLLVNLETVYAMDTKRVDLPRLEKMVFQNCVESER